MINNNNFDGSLTINSDACFFIYSSAPSVTWGISFSIAVPDSFSDVIIFIFSRVPLFVKDIASFVNEFAINTIGRSIIIIIAIVVITALTMSFFSIFLNFLCTGKKRYASIALVNIEVSNGFSIKYDK